MRRAVITGIGVICATGRNRKEFLNSLQNGCCGIAPLEGAEIWDLRFRCGGQVRGFDPMDYMSPKEADMIDRFAQFALVAAREAVRQSGIEWTDELRETSAIITGSCVGGQATENQGFYDVYKMGGRASIP